MDWNITLFTFILNIIALLQGLFLVFILISKKNLYKKIPFYLFLSLIISVILFILFDENSIFSIRILYFDLSLFIVLLYLFIKNLENENNHFDRRNFFFFIPSIFYFIVEILEHSIYSEEYVLISVFEMILTLILIGFLVKSIQIVYYKKKYKWLVYFIVPITILVCKIIVSEIAGLMSLNIGKEKDSIISVVLVLFYFIAYKLIIVSKDDEFIPMVKNPKHIKKYVTSTLSEEKSVELKNKLIYLMEHDKYYLNKKLTIDDLSTKLNVSKQYISEVLSKEMNTNFNEFVNSYRVQTFIEYLKKEKYSNLTLFGIAQEAGFNSKTTFNSSFKKINGLTPSQYRDSLQENH